MYWLLLRVVYNYVPHQNPGSLLISPTKGTVKEIEDQNSL